MHGTNIKQGQICFVKGAVIRLSSALDCNPRVLGRAPRRMAIYVRRCDPGGLALGRSDHQGVGCLPRLLPAAVFVPSRASQLCPATVWTGKAAMWLSLVCSYKCDDVICMCEAWMSNLFLVKGPRV
jgi:hypothetical protein